MDRLWKSDPTLWANADEAKWTGWLNIVESELAGLDVLERGADDAREAAFKYVVVLGMGGSSLCPDVLRQTFGPQRGCPELVVIDSVVPAQLRTALRKLDLRHSLFIVASKSGGRSNRIRSSSSSGKRRPRSWGIARWPTTSWR